MASGDTKTQQYLDIAANGTRADLQRGCCDTRTQSLIMDVAERIIDVEEEVERLENNPDVADIVATYADLQSYDTSQLTDKDVIRVLQDETHDGDSTYYRWSTSTNTWTYIGESKQYTDFTGTDGTTAGTHGLVPAPATTDAGKFLKADGTWDTAGGGGPTVVQTTGTSQTDVMSQNATTSMVFSDPATQRSVRIGNERATGNYSVNIGYSGGSSTGYVSGMHSIGVGDEASIDTGTDYSVAIGSNSQIGKNMDGTVALGAYSGSNINAAGIMDIGSSRTTYGYNNSNYRLLSGLYDGQSAHDAVTYGQLSTAIINGGTTAPTTATVGAVGTLYSAVVSNTAHLYACTAIDDTTDPQNPSYTWTTLV